MTTPRKTSKKRGTGEAPGPARGWGGHRPGAGRKPKGAFAQVAHERRPRLRRGAPVLITMEFARGLPDLARGRPAEVLVAALRACDGRRGFTLLAHALHPDHAHLIARARDRAALSRAMTGLCVRVARTLNSALARRGTVFADRYEVRVLATPRELAGARRSPCTWRAAADSSGPRRPSVCLREGGLPAGPRRRG